MTKPSIMFWVIVLLGLLWNALGCFNFIMQSILGAVADLPLAYKLVIASRPGWVSCFLYCGFRWGVGLRSDAAAPCHGAACFVSVPHWRAVDHGLCALAGGCGHRRSACGNFKWHVRGSGGRFGLVHALQAGA